MKHVMKVMLALALSALLALSMLALAENEATEVEALDGEIAAENVDAASGEADAELSEEIEADLTPDAEEETPEETSGEVRVEEDAEEEEETGEEESAEEESVEEESAEEASAEEASSDEESSEDAPVVENAETVEDAETPAEAETAEAEALLDLVTDEAAAPMAVEGLVYTGEPQALVIGPDDGTILYSLDGENYSPEIPTGVNAGEYTVYYKMTKATEEVQEADEAIAAEEAQEAVQDAETETVAILTVTIAKADVTLIPPIAFNVEE